MKHHRQENLEEIVLAGIADRQRHMPLERLASGERIPLNRYWQAMTLVEMLVSGLNVAKKYGIKYNGKRIATLICGSNLTAEQMHAWL